MKPEQPKRWSAQQEDIFKEFETGKNNVVVRARAGTGKTTTIIEGVNRAPEGKILLAAFNKRIADELKLRLKNPAAEAKTLHAIGFGCVVRFWEKLSVCSRNERADALAEKVCGVKVPDSIKKLVSKLHTKGREIRPHAREASELLELAYTFDCEPDEQWEGSQFTVEFVCQKAVEAMELAATVKPVDTGIDFADMIYLPVRNGWLQKRYDLVVVDEAQDMTVAQLEIAQGVCRGRVVVVGDDRQAIYSFRGADSNSLDRLKRELNAKEFGLNITYRCGRVITEAAARLVPDFQAGPSNPEGCIETLHIEKLKDSVALGDFVLSRLNAPLVELAMSLLRNGKRARIAGRDIGAGLRALIRKLAKGPAAHSIPAFLTKLSAWEKKEVTRWTAADRPDRVDSVRDRAAMLTDLAANARSVRDVEDRIEALFTDDGLGQAGVITCSSVHRAKGLEAERVFVLMDTLYPRNNYDIEEQNIEYVAITRAKQTLVLVSSKAVA